MELQFEQVSYLNWEICIVLFIEVYMYMLFISVVMYMSKKQL